VRRLQVNVPFILNKLDILTIANDTNHSSVLKNINQINISTEKIETLFRECMLKIYKTNNFNQEKSYQPLAS
jgi:hypothetical protein